ncbi:MAG: hypothetical protein AVDCRST_MAG86-1273 [uncultured Truepera sp.]|uniref:Uncharacterized protein n=1 Tax=uncultured Truepera sp. TaxID=543023 RepID=A0A6J4V885_9DEIN|nr:MAG: hypothetical protein AVDCRST_MAG86-1273 [uncultured Truepera sp.]
MARADLSLGGLTRYYRQSSTLQKVLFIVGTLLLVVMVFHLAALLITGGPLSGPISLRKPATFAETGWLLCWSVGWLLPLVKLKSWEKGFVAAGALLFGVGETLVAAVQAWRGVPFHYYVPTPFDGVIFGFAGIDAAVFLASVLVLLRASLRHQELAPSLLLAVRLGTVILFVGTLTGVLMILNWSGVWQGGPPGLFRPGFDTDNANFSEGAVGGNLVVIHAVGVHGLSLMLLPAWLLTLSRLREGRRVRLTAAVGGATLAGLAVLQVAALTLRPLGSLDLWAELLLGVTLVGFFWSYLLVGRAALRGLAA